MAEQVKVEIVEGPGELDLFLRSLIDGKQVQFTLDLNGGQRKVNTIIDGVHRVTAIDCWGIEGRFANPEVWAEFTTAIYNPKTRKGYFVFDSLEPHPVCGHPVPKGLRYCNQCGRDRMDVG